MFAIEEFPQLREIVDQGFDNPANVEIVSSWNLLSITLKIWSVCVQVSSQYYLQLVIAMDFLNLILFAGFLVACNVMEIDGAIYFQVQKLLCFRHQSDKTLSLM